MTQKSKYLMVFLLFVTSVFSFNGRDGCGCDKGVWVPAKPPTCVGSTYKDYFYEYDHISGWPIFYDTNGFFLHYAYYQKGHVFERNSAPQVNTYEALTVPSPGMFEQIYNVLGTYWYNHRDQNLITDAYACGIDSLRGIQDPDYTNSIGLSQTRGAYSFVFVQAIQTNPSYFQNTPQYVEAVLAHELGHQITFNNIPHSSGHSGVDNSNCIMRSPLNQNQIIPSVQFCDTHICEIYTCVPNECPADMFYFLGEEGTVESNENFSVNIALQKEQPFEGEAAFLDITIKNVSTGRDSIKHLGPSGLARGIRVINNRSEVSTNKVMDPLTTKEPYYILEPGEERTYTIDLLYFYGMRANEFLVIGNPYELPPDDYTVQFVGLDDVYGKNILSNKINLKVNTLSAEQQTELSELRELYKMGPTESQALRYKDYAHKYENGTFMEQSFYYYISLAPLVKEIDKDEVIRECKWFLSKKSNSEFLSTIIPMCAEIVLKNKGKSAHDAFLEEIKSTYPNTKAATVANKTQNKK